MPPVYVPQDEEDNEFSHKRRNLYPFFRPPDETFDVRMHQWQVEHDKLTKGECKLRINSLLQGHVMHKMVSDKASQEVDRHRKNCEELSRRLGGNVITMSQMVTVANGEEENEDEDNKRNDREYETSNDGVVKREKMALKPTPIYSHFYNLDVLDDDTYNRLVFEHQEKIKGVRSYWRSQIAELEDYDAITHMQLQARQHAVQATPTDF